MSCALDQITISGLSHPTLNPNGVYIKKDPVGSIPIVYEKDAGGGAVYRLWGPVPFASNSFRLAYYPTSSSDTSFAQTGFGQSAICPDLLTGWTNLGSTTGTLLITGDQSTGPTFGLPADVVALITSRFGTVANFLRLRNQGQV